AVARMAKTSPRARTLSALHSGLSLESRHVDTKALALEYDANSLREPDAPSLPREPGALLDLAESLLARSRQPAERRFAAVLVRDARHAAAEAEKLGAKGARLDAVLAVAAAELNDLDAARARAIAAVEGGLLRGSDGATLTPASR